jgi:hypothetical protein
MGQKELRGRSPEGCKANDAVEEPKSVIVGGGMLAGLGVRNWIRGVTLVSGTVHVRFLHEMAHSRSRRAPTARADSSAWPTASSIACGRSIGPSVRCISPRNPPLSDFRFERHSFFIMRGGMTVLRSASCDPTTWQVSNG